ncbi:MAG: hypothetical protein AB8H12_21435 [Lewinella sp.]
MITINLLNHNTRLPLRNRSVQLIFMDTVFGWLRLHPTDNEGVTTAQTYPGMARVYVDGELLEERWLEGEIELLIKEGENVDEEQVEDDFSDEARTQVHMPVDEQGESASLLTAVVLDSETNPGYLTA